MSRFHKFDEAALRIAPALDLDLKSQPDGTITGYASTFGGKPDRHGDVVLPGAFARTLSEHKAEGTMPAMLWGHRLEEPVGHWTDMKEDQKGLFVRGRLNLKTARGREAYAHVEAGDAGAFSIGFLLPEGGRKYAGDGSYHLSDIDLVEISIVTVPSNSRARIAGVKSLSSKSELVDLLREAGLAKTAASRIAAGGWPALSGDEEATQKAINLAAAIERRAAALKGL